MLSAIKEIGELLLAQENKNPLDVLIENPDSNGTYKLAFVLNFDKNLNFLEITSEELKADYRLYLYKKGSGANAPDFSPTSRITEPQKTFTKKTLKWFSNHINHPDCQKIFQELTKNEKEIVKKLTYLNEKSRDGKILTLKIDGKYLYEIDFFRNFFLQDIFSKIQEISHKNGVCSICGEKKSLVFSTSGLYKFYTTDKECYIASGFDKNSSWKNFPICEDCFLKITYGKKFIEKHLTFKFYGKTYRLIPKVLLNTREALEEVKEILEASAKDIKLGNTFSDDEREILEVVKDYKDVISFYFLFLKGGATSDSERILLLIEDVLPSRISMVFKAKSEVETLFKEKYNFGRFNKFLGSFDNLFFEVVDKIFKGGNIHFRTLLQVFNKKIRSEIGNSRNFKSTIRDALMNIKFLEKLGILTSETTKEVKEMEKSKFEQIFEKIGSSLNTPAKRGIFLLGALTQMLLNLQSENKPFLKQLKGLKMNEEDIKGLLPKVINKFLEYKKFDKGKQEIAKEISKYLLAQERFGLTTDEINFYFAAGMSLYEEITNIVYENKQGGNENGGDN